MFKVRIEVERTCFPRVTTWHVRRILRWVPERDLEGLELVRVVEDSPYDEFDAARVPAYMRGFLYNGMYLRKEKNRSAQILLFANDIYFGIPKVLFASPVATLKIARTLVHEVAHHVIASRGYIYEPSERYKPWNGPRNPDEEKMADRYAAEVTDRMARHWLYKLGKLSTLILSHRLYQAGLKDYSDENYRAAASRLARAHSLNLANEDAGQSFRHAMEKLKTQTLSLTEMERDWLLKKYSSRPVTATRKPYLSGKR